jgi:hypothetical protein
MNMSPPKMFCFLSVTTCKCYVTLNRYRRHIVNGKNTVDCAVWGILGPRVVWILTSWPYFSKFIYDFV